AGASRERVKGDRQPCTGLRRLAAGSTRPLPRTGEVLSGRMSTRSIPDTGDAERSGPSRYMQRPPDQGALPVSLATATTSKRRLSSEDTLALWTEYRRTNDRAV